MACILPHHCRCSVSTEDRALLLQCDLLAQNELMHRKWYKLESCFDLVKFLDGT